MTTGLAVLATAEDPPPFRFGMDAGSIAAQTAAGVAPDYGTFWVGPWTLKHGWGGPDAQMASMRAQGVTPAIHLYYWGDDISRSCIENGCWSSLHQAQKDKAGWQRLTDELVAHLQTQMNGEPAVIFLETEFNKADVQEYEPLDGYLAQKAQQVHAGYPAAKVVLSLGSWNTPAWKTWDRAAAASDAIGLQGMRGSTRDTPTHYDNLFADTLRHAQTAQSLFGKPIFLQDLALSTYPEPDYVQRQADGLQRFFDGMPQLRAAGVEAMVYRSWKDTDMDLANYYGQAERHWGLAYKDGTSKPSAKVWIDGVKAVRGATPVPFWATFAPSPGNNAWWVEVAVEAASAPQVAASHNGGPWIALTSTTWGTFAKSFHAPAGGTMTFRATDARGQSVSEAFPWLPNGAPQASFTHAASGLRVDLDAAGSSDPDGDALSYAWNLGDGRSGTGMTLRHDYAAAGTYTVRLTVSDGKATAQTTSQVTVTAPNRSPSASFTTTVDGLTVRVDGRASTDPDGDPLRYTWTFGDGTTANGSTAQRTYAAPGSYSVELLVHDGKSGATTSRNVSITAPAFTATFTPAKNVNQYWVDVRVDASAPPARVEARAGDGNWVVLPSTSWGTYAKSFYAPPGTMSFRATDAYGQQATTTVDWLKTPFAATFTPAKNVNQYWVDVRVDASAPPSKVEARAGTGAWIVLEKTSWGTYAKSFYAPPGTMSFRATDASGQQVSTTVEWLKPTFAPTFTPKTQDNRWWVETQIKGDGISKVELRKDGGAWQPMGKTTWGSWALSLDARGTIEFRATSSSGDLATSPAYRWG